MENTTSFAATAFQSPHCRQFVAMALHTLTSRSGSMSQQIIKSNSIASSTSKDTKSVQQYHIRLQNPRQRQALARFIKQRTTTSSSEDKTVVVLSPVVSSLAEHNQTSFPSDSDTDNDSGNCNQASLEDFSTANGDIISETINESISSTTSSAENIDVTAADYTTTSSTDKSKEIEITPSSNVSSGRLRSSGRPPRFAPAIRPAFESPFRRASGSHQRSISKTPQAHRESWASLWSAKYHEKHDASDSGYNDSQSRASQESLPVSETTGPRPGTRFDPNGPSKAAEDSSVDQNSRKSTGKFSHFCQRLIQKPNNNAPPLDLWDTVYDGSDPYNLLEDSDDGYEYNPFELNLPPHLSRYKSELDYLRRTQEEECLEWQKRRLFCTKGNHTRYVIEPINIYS